MLSQSSLTLIMSQLVILYLKFDIFNCYKLTTNCLDFSLISLKTGMLEEVQDVESKMRSPSAMSGQYLNDSTSEFRIVDPAMDYLMDGREEDSKIQTSIDAEEATVECNVYSGMCFKFLDFKYIWISFWKSKIKGPQTFKDANSACQTCLMVGDLRTNNWSISISCFFLAVVINKSQIQQAPIEHHNWWHGNTSSHK